MQSLDEEVLAPVLDRVRRGAITVTLDEYRRECYRENGRPCHFTTHLLERLCEQGYCRWDSMIVEDGRLVARQDGIAAVRLDDKGRELHKRLCELTEAEHDDEQQRGWYVGRCGHPVPVMGSACFIGPCPDCEPAS